MQRKMALFVDFENIARGVRQRHLEERVDLRAILDELEQHGRLLVKRAYGDWSYFKDYRSDLLQNSIEPVQVFAASRDREGWKNGADIRIAIDAVETVFRFPEITDFVLVSGDSDFLSLVNKLRENGKTVRGVGLKFSSSQYLVKSCDHYTFYEEVADWLADESPDTPSGQRRDGRSLLLATVRRMTDRQGLPGMPPPGTPLKASAVATSMRRMDPAWDEHSEGHPSFLAFLHAHEDVVLYGQPLDGSEHFIAERGTISEINLRRMLDARNGHAEAPVSDQGPLVREELVDAIRRAARRLQGSGADPEAPQRVPVRGMALRARLVEEIRDFQEGSYGADTFLDLLLSLREWFRVGRSEPRADVLVAERGSPAEHSIEALPEPSSGSFAPGAQTPTQRYVTALRMRRIRYVPMADRYRITQTLCRIFDDAKAQGEDISLKEAKDRLHRWYEETDPSVPWECVNNVVYHLFWTYNFEFGEGSDDVPLWDRPTCWQGGLETPEDVIRRCDTGLVKMISEIVGVVDPGIVLEVLGDQNEERRAYFEEVCAQVNQRFSQPLLK